MFRASEDDVVSSKSFLRDCGSLLHHWEILYCGGSRDISRTLAGLTASFGIAYRHESYGAW